MEQATHKERVVLPTTVKPSKYNITLQPDLKNFTFTYDPRLCATQRSLFVALPRVLNVETITLN